MDGVGGKARWALNLLGAGGQAAQEGVGEIPSEANEIDVSWCTQHDV